MEYANGGSSLVMVSVRVGPRLEDGCVSKNFHVLQLVMVSRRYANKVLQELAYDIFDTFPYCILMSSPAVMTVNRVELRCDCDAVRDGTDSVRRIRSISHIEREYTRRS